MADAPQPADWLKTNVPEGLTVFRAPPACLCPPAAQRAGRQARRVRRRTTNMQENVNKQVKRRTREAGLFPHPEAAFCLVSAVLMGISEDRKIDRVYLSMDAEKSARSP